MLIIFLYEALRLCCVQNTYVGTQYRFIISVQVVYILTLPTGGEDVSDVDVSEDDLEGEEGGEDDADDGQPTSKRRKTNVKSKTKKKKEDETTIR